MMYCYEIEVEMNYYGKRVNCRARKPEVGCRDRKVSRRYTELRVSGCREPGTSHASLDYPSRNRNKNVLRVEQAAENFSRLTMELVQKQSSSRLQVPEQRGGCVRVW
jgi:hypothetical protein